MTFKLSFEENPNQNDVQILIHGITDYAKQQRGFDVLDFFAFFIRDENNKVVGGCSGGTLYGGLHIDNLWVSEIIRNKGWGTKLVNAALTYGQEKNCNFATVNTMDWEALDFYQKLGFRVEFKRTGFHKNSIFYFLRKEFLQPNLSKTELDQNGRIKRVDVEIIPITEEHIEGFWSAVDSVAREHKYLAFLKGPPVNTTRDFVLGNIEGNWPHFIAVSDGKIIGWCDISALDRPVFSHIGSLGIGVLAAYRGLGIGKNLLQTAIQKAAQKGLTRIELTVRENNKPAIALYEKFGFEIEGMHKNAVCIDGKYENHMFMALLLGDAKN